MDPTQPQNRSPPGTSGHPPQDQALFGVKHLVQWHCDTLNTSIIFSFIAVQPIVFIELSINWPLTYPLCKIPYQSLVRCRKTPF